MTHWPTLVPHPMMRAALAAVVVATVWLPATSAPFWQDDYPLLVEARDAGGAPGLAALAPRPERAFWRPLGADVWGWVLHGPLGGDPRRAHVATLVLLLCSAAAVGWLAATVTRVLAGSEGGHDLAGVAAATLYGLHASHFLPVAWAAAANDSLAVLFAALSLRFWVAASASPTGAWPSFIAAVICFALALASRESAVVVPAIAAVLTAWLGSRRPMRPAMLVTGMIAAVLTIVWAVARSVGGDPDPAYDLRLGANVARNAVSLSLFAINMPREAFRFLLTAPATGVAVWAVACVVLQVAVVMLLVRLARPRLDRRAVAALAAIFVIGCAPFLLLAWNSYEYYASIGLIAFAILAATAVPRSRDLVVIVVLAAASTSAVIAGSLALDYPALLARAQWGERQLQQIARWQADGRLAARPIAVFVEQEHKWMAIGSAGLAYRLGVPLSEIVVIRSGAAMPSQASVLVVPVDGDVQLR